MTPHSRGSSIVILSLACFPIIFGAPSTSDATQTLYLDVSSLGTELDKLTDAVFGIGSGVFDAGEKMFIEDEILTQVGIAFADYDVDFTTTVPGSGDFTTIDFGALSGTPLELGKASFDPFNTMDGFTVDVYVANHSITIDEFPDPFSGRFDQMFQVATGLASTAIHEVGHTFGLDHYDAYGTMKIDPPMYMDTKGFQNMHYMATGETGVKIAADGMPELWDTMPLSYSPYSKAKLEWGKEGKLIDSRPGALTADPDGPSYGPASNNTSGTATPLTLSPSPISSTFSGLVELGEIDADTVTDLVDYYSITVPTGAGGMFLTANTFSKPEFDPAVQLDTKLELISPDGMSIEFSDLSLDDMHYAPDMWGSAAMAGGFDEQDSMILNVPLLEGETYYIKVSAQSPTGLPAEGPAPPVDLDGFYHLFVSLKPIPEPGGVAFAVLVMVGLLIRQGGHPGNGSAS